MNPSARRTPYPRLILSLGLALLLAGCCPGEPVDERGWPKELVLGLVPALEADALVDNLDPLAEYLEAELGIPVTSFVPQDYTGLVEALGAGRACCRRSPRCWVSVATTSNPS